MIDIIHMYLGIVILWLVVYKIGEILFTTGDTKMHFLNIICIALFASITTFMNILNTEVLNGVLKIIITYSLFCTFYKINFKTLYSKIIIVSLVFYLISIASEVIIAIPLSIVSEMAQFNLSVLKNSIIINVSISALSLLITYKLKSRLIQLVNNDRLMTKSGVFIIIIVLIVLALLGFRIPVTKWKFNTEFLITMIILFLFCIVGIYMLKQNSDIQKTKAMYQQVVKYSNTTNKLLEDYRIVSHEHQNQLSIIRQMVKGNNNEIIEYIDNLLDKRNIIKYKWVTDLNNLSLEGLKGLINYKLLEMEENKITVTVTISKDLSKFKSKLNKLTTKQKDNLYSIVGVYLDNAMQAAGQSRGRLVNIDFYRENKDIVMIFANSYSGNIDIKKIDDYGYSTKGKNHGIGLHIVKRIIEEDHIFVQQRKVLKDYYIQELRIHTNEIKK